MGSDDGERFYLVVENNLPIEVRIWAVVLVGREGHWQLHLKYLRPAAPGPIAHAALLNAIGHDKHPTRIVAGAHFSTEVDPRVAVSLAGFTGGLWGVEYEEFHKRQWEIEGGWMVVEYPTLFGGSAYFRLSLDPATIRGIKDMVSRIRSEYK